MSAIRLQFVTEAGLGAALIRWFGGGAGRAVSHVDAVLPDGMLFGARNDRSGGRPPGVWPRPPGYAQFTRRILVTIPATAQQERAFLEFLARQKGLPYDWRAILGFLAARDWRDPRAWICSELQARALEVAGLFPKSPFLLASAVTPTMLAEAASILPGASIGELPP